MTSLAEAKRTIFAIDKIRIDENELNIALATIRRRFADINFEKPNLLAISSPCGDYPVTTLKI